MSYKSDRHRIEDCMIAAILEALMICHLKQIEDQRSYDKALKLLAPDIKAEVKDDKKILKRLFRLQNVVLGFFEDNGWHVSKGFMIISGLANALHLQGQVNLGEGTKEVVSNIFEIIDNHLDEEEINKQLSSAQKQIPKVLTLIQKEGYF